MNGMATPKKTGRPKKKPSDKKVGTSMHVSISVDLRDRLEAFCESHAYKPAMTKVIELAIEEYLDKHETTDQAT